MSHVFRQKVYYSDTDAYGVVWHGSYLRWLEMGRVLLCEAKGQSLKQLEDSDVVLPVVELNVKYKNSARLDDEITIETKITNYDKFSLTFFQRIIDEKTGRIYIEAICKVVAINKDGKLYRSLPDEILGICNQ